LCNSSSIGKRFSFNFPSGKKWTLSPAEDARARAFYCGVGPVVNPQPDPYPVADIIYCTGGEGAYDGTPTYWESNARKGCKTNNNGESTPYGQLISKSEYDSLSQGTLCVDGTRDFGGGRRALCLDHGGVMGENPPVVSPFELDASNYQRCPQGKIRPQEFVNGRLSCKPGYNLGPEEFGISKCVCTGWVDGGLVDGIGCPTNPQKNANGEVIAYNLAKTVGSMIARENGEAYCDPSNTRYQNNNLSENEFHREWMQTAISGFDSDGYTWTTYTNFLLRKNCPETFKILYDIANAEYKQNLGRVNCLGYAR
jgi:hypothetical protein